MTNTPLPSLLYGTAWKELDTAALVLQALTCGFRGIDTANQRRHYFEEGVGEGIQAACQQLELAREDLFLQSKYTYPRGQDHRKPYDENSDFSTQVQHSFISSLAHLNTDYLDSYILHGPYEQSGISKEDKEVWRTMESLHAQGKIRHIGVSNVNYAQLQMLTDFATVKPSFVQNRCFAQMFWDKQIREFCRAHNIIYQGFSLLTANQRELNHPKIEQIARVYDKSVAQIIFRFAQQMGMLPITGTTNTAHMNADLNIADFSLTTDEINFIETIGIAE